MDLLSYLTAKDMDTGNFVVKKMIILGTDQLCYLTAEYAEGAEGMNAGNSVVKKRTLSDTDLLSYLTAEYAEYAEGDECG